MNEQKLVADATAGFSIEALGGFEPDKGLINTIFIILARVGWELWSERRKRKRERNASVTKSPPEETL